MGMLVATGQITIVDTNDSLSTGSTPPLNPVANVTLWCDTSVTPNQLKKWNGTKWEIVNEVTVGGRNLVRNSSNFKDLSYWNSYGANPGGSGDIVTVGTIKCLHANRSNLATGAYQLFKQTLPSILKKNTEYTLSYMSKVTGHAGDVYFYSAATTNINRFYIPLSSAFVKNTITFNTGSGDDISIIRFDCVSAGVGINSEIWIYDIKLEEGNKATDYTEAPEDTQAKIAALDYLKAAMTGSTEIAGGLTATNVLLLKTLAGLITGGMSGLADDNIGFWTGGTYADAIANLANIILRKDGSGQLAGGGIKWNASGSLLEVVGHILAQSGKIGGLDIFADTLKSNSMSFTENPTETLASLLAPLTSSISNQSSWSNSQTNAEAHAYTQALAVTVDSQIKFKATAIPDPALNDRNWLVYLNDSSGNRVFSQSGSGSISNQLFTVNVPAGTYTIHATAGGLMNLGQTYTNTASITGDASATIYATGYSYQTKIGNNGFYSFWNVLQYLYYSSEQGLKVRGAVDMPAGLGGSSVTSGGSVSGTWGKVTGCSRSGSTVTINHSGIGDSKYTVQVSPNGSSTWYFQNRTDSSIQVVCSGTFDFILVRTPY